MRTRKNRKRRKRNFRIVKKWNADVNFKCNIAKDILIFYNFCENRLQFSLFLQYFINWEKRERERNQNEIKMKWKTNKQK